MADERLDGYLTKTQAAQRFHRHKSTITRGINAALRAQDEKVLDLCKVKTADGKILGGDEVSPEMLSQLHNDGLRPVWYLLPEVMDLMIKRDSAARESPDEAAESSMSDGPKEVNRSMDTGPDRESPNYVSELEKELAVATEKLARVEQENKRLFDDKEYFKEQAKVVTELQRDDNVVRAQTNELMKELLNRLQVSDQTALPRAKTPRSKSLAVTTTESVTEGMIVPNSRNQATSTEGKQPAKKRASSGRKRPLKGKKPMPERKASESRQPKAKPPTTTERFLPTLSKFLGRSK